MKTKKKSHHLRFGRKKAASSSSPPKTDDVQVEENEPEGVKQSKLYVKLTPMVEETKTTCPSLTSIVLANDERHPVGIDNEWFTGVACIRVREFAGWTPIDTVTGKPLPSIPGSKYFEGHRRQFSLQVMGRFKKPFTADDVLFGTWFDKPLRLPHGWSLAVGIAQRIDASMVYELNKAQPYLCSPLICAMNTVRIVAEGVPLTYSHKDILQNHWDYWDGKRLEENLPLRDVIHTTNATATTTNSSVLHPNSSSSNPTTPTKGDKHANIVNNTTINNANSRSGSVDLPSASSVVNDEDLLAGQVDNIDLQHMTDEQLDVLDQQSRHSISSANQGGLMGFIFGGSSAQISKSSHSAHARRKFYLDPERRKNFTFQPDTVYSFDFYSPYVDVSRMKIKLGISIDLMSYLNDQPITYYARSRHNPNIIFFRIEIGQL